MTIPFFAKKVQDKDTANHEKANSTPSVEPNVARNEPSGSKWYDVWKDVTGRRVSSEEMSRISKKDDLPGTGMLYSVDRIGRVTMTPVQGRKSLYRDVFKIIKGKNYSQEEADRAAMDDMSKAQRARHSKLSSLFKGLIGKFDPNTNYAVAPHRTYVPFEYKDDSGNIRRSDEDMASSFGEIDRPIPVTENRPLRETNIGYLAKHYGLKPGANGVNRFISLIKHPATGKYVSLHEILHGIIPYFYGSPYQKSSYIENDKTPGKGPHYAAKQMEGLVGVLAEKARLRAQGVDGQKGLGRFLANDVIKNFKNLPNGKREFDLNVRSLRNIIMELHKKATSPRATEADKKNWEDFLDWLDESMEQASNDRGVHDGVLRPGESNTKVAEIANKCAQVDDYTNKGGLIGAVAGGALSAILSSLYYGSKKKDVKKQSFAKRFIKGLLWTGAGALGGGLIGSGLGRAVGTHLTYKKNLEDTIRRISEAGGDPKKGRLILVNYPDNVYKGEKGGLINRFFPNGAPVQHAGVITMDEDGGNAKFFGVGVRTGDINKKIGRDLIMRGLKSNDNDLIAEGISSYTGRINRGSMTVRHLGDVLKGKNDEDIAKVMADFGKLIDFGDKVEIYEGNRGIDRRIPEMFARVATRRANGSSGDGYGIAPGSYNCGTAGRDMFNTVNGNLNHWLDMLYGGFPSSNMPIRSKKTTASSYSLENRDNMFSLLKPKLSLVR